MKEFLLKSLTWGLLGMISIYAIFYLAGGYTDPFYLKFASEKQNSLILGNSRAGQGIKPEVLNNRLNRKDMFNYSFTLGHSPYGRIYLNSIKKKLKKDTQKGIFILAVDPWSISSITKDPNDSLNFREVNGTLENMEWVNAQPNLEYIFFECDLTYFDFIFNTSKSIRLHNDGWMEMTSNMDEKIVQERKQRMIGIYSDEHLPVYNYSSKRLDLLKETIEFLKKEGDVYLVRLPVSDEILKIENRLMNDFDERISCLAKETSVPYFNMIPHRSSFKYTDGNHLYKSSATRATEMIGKFIEVTNSATNFESFSYSPFKNKLGFSSSFNFIFTNQTKSY